MYKLLSLGILLCFCNSECICSDPEKRRNAGIGRANQFRCSSKSAEASDTDETVIYLAWAIAWSGKSAPMIEAVDRLAFKDSPAVDDEDATPTVKFNDMTDDYILKGRDKLKIRL